MHLKIFWFAVSSAHIYFSCRRTFLTFSLDVVVGFLFFGLLKLTPALFSFNLASLLNLTI